jgi:hypothetical protein
LLEEEPFVYAGTSLLRQHVHPPPASGIDRIDRWAIDLPVITVINYSSILSHADRREQETDTG